MSDFLERITKLSPKRLALLALELQTKLEALEGSGREPIAIVGMGCRMPGGADSPADLWRLLQQGGDGIVEVPADRWDVDAIFDPDPDAAGKISTRFGGFLRDVARFDAEFFGITPREAASMDPQQRLMLEVAWEALEDAGQAPDALAGSATGVFVGVCNADYFQRIVRREATALDAYVATGGAHSVAAGRLAYLLGLQGPNLAVDTACSSSLVAVHLACQSLRNRECRLALAGGVNVILTPEVTMMLSRAHMMAPDGRCKAFDARADGFVRGEGAGLVVLKRLSDAQADGDEVLAVIRGTAINQDGRSNGLTAPNGPAQEAVLRSALADARVAAHEIAYVEAHGTGTSLGDPIELRALGAVFGAGRASDRPVLVGSVKANVGHLESAAGIAGLIKVVLAMRHGEIPRQLHFETPNPHIPWADLPIAVPTTPRRWPDGPRLAGVSSFGFSGTNAHVILEAVTSVAAERATPAAQVLTLSARAEPALRALAERWARELRRPGVAVSALCATANGGRAALEHRLAVTMATAEQGAERLDAFARSGVAAGSISRRVAKGRTPEVAFLFTGQGAQYAGMGRRLYDGHPSFRAAIDRCDAAVREVWEPRLVDVLSGAAAGASIDDTAYTQVAMFAIEWALAETWRSWGVIPGIVLGHSVGEYVAACVAGVLQVEEAIRIVAARGRLMGALPPGGVMVAVSASEARVREVLASARNGVAEIAAINGPESVVIAGEADTVSALVTALGDRSIASQPLRVSHAFHTTLMTPMQEGFAASVAGVSPRAPRIPLVSTVSGQIVSAATEMDAAYWVRQVRAPVRFGAALEQAWRRVGDALWVEIGPHPVLTALAQPWLTGGEWVPSLRRGHDDWATLLAAVGTVWARGVRVDWRGDQARGRRTMTGLPTYPFQRERHWLDETPARPAIPMASTHAHPLLGSRVRSATGTPHFEAVLAADQPVFLDDHRVHGHALLPSPVQMEMAAAAAARVLGDERPLLVDFAIEQPLVLPAAPRPIQTVVTPDGPGSVSIAIASLENEASDRWQVHVRVTARRRATTVSERDGDQLAEVRRRCQDSVDGDAFYAMAASRGLDFGPAFRGIERVWRGPREALAEIRIPSSIRGDQELYRIHPAVLDACLQSLGGALDGDDGATYLLVGADEISLPAAGDASVPAWSHARLRATGPRTDAALIGDVRVLDASGVAIATVAGIHLRRARPESLARGGASRATDLVYRVAWKLAPRTGAALTGPAELVAAIEAQAGGLEAAEGLAMYDSLVPALEALSARYVVRAFHELGWSPEPGVRIETESIATALGVERKRHRLLSRLLDILTEEGMLKREGAGWRVIARLPEADVETAERALRAQCPGGAPEAAVTMNCGRAVAAVLRGQTDPLQILFGPDTRANTERLYRDTPAARTFNALIAEAVAGAIGTTPRARRVRILEIGAGTGGATGAILSALTAETAEYVFTDVSPAFTSRAAERLGAPNRSFRPLDIEREPAAQGFAGERFDIVVAANVIHATRDLRRTMGHVRDLLAPGGLLILLEGTARYRWVDLTFGLTDGWWHFTDLDLRPEHALLDGERWIELLRACGLQEPARLPARPSGRALMGQTVLIARAPVAEPAAVPGRRDWLVLADRGGIARQLVSSLEARGQRVRAIEPGDGAPIEATIRSGCGWHAVVDLRALDAGSLAGADVASALHTQALDLIKALAEANGAPRLWLVTRGAQPAGGGHESLAVAQAPLWGLGRVIALEQPELWGGLVDLDAADTPADAAERLAVQLIDPDEEDQLAFRVGRRVVPRLVRDVAPTDAPLAVRGDGTYLITGGLGGLGLKVARWLVEQGARHLVLTGRRGLPAREPRAASSADDRRSTQMTAIQELEQLGATVDTVAADVADRAAMTTLFASFGSTRPSLRGIVHAAADVRGELLAEATAEGRDAVLAPKVAGSWLLHELSRERPLDFFVLFSSTTALLGSARLGHYAAANQFLDALAHERRGEGLPALSVNWGTWDEMRTATESDRRAFVQGGLLPMRSEDALALLGRLAAAPAAQATVAAVDWDALIALYEVKRPRPLLTELRHRPDAAAAPARPRAVALRKQLETVPAETRRDVVLQHVRGEVASVLGLEPSRVDVEQGLFDMGMDSLMAVDVKARLETSVGQRLASTLTFNYPTVAALTAYLANQVLGLAAEPAATETAPPAPEVSQSHDDLTEDELAMLLAEKLGRIR